MQRILVPSILILLLASACQQNTFTLCGSVEGGEGHTMWLEELAPEGPIFIDSIPIDRDGRFKYKYPMPYPSFYNLHTSADNYIVTLPSCGETIVVNGRWDNLSMTYTVSGSPESELLWELQQYTNNGGTALKNLVDTSERYSMLMEQGAVGKETVAAKKRETDSIYRMLRAEQVDNICTFIDNHKGSLSTLIALYKPFNNKPLINARDTSALAWYDFVLEGLEARYPDNPHTVHFRNTVGRMPGRAQRP